LAQSRIATGENKSVLLALPIWLILPLVPLVLTLLAWREGLRALATAESKDGLRSRTLLPMLFLAAPVAMLLGSVGLQAGHFASLTAPGRMMIIGSAAAVAALITATRSPRGFRPLAIFAAAAWVLCYGLPLLAMFALAGLR
jgi:hypothetical protein